MMILLVTLISGILPRLCAPTFMWTIEVVQIMDQVLDEDNSGLMLGSIEVVESQLSGHFKSENQILPQELLAAFLQNFSAPWVYCKVVIVGVSFFEQECRYTRHKLSFTLPYCQWFCNDISTLNAQKIITTSYDGSFDQLLSLTGPHQNGTKLDRFSRMDRAAWTDPTNTFGFGRFGQIFSLFTSIMF